MPREFSSCKSGDFLLCMMIMIFRLLSLTSLKSKCNKRPSLCVLPNSFPKIFSRVAGNTLRSYCLCLPLMVMLRENDCLQREIFFFRLHNFYWQAMHFSHGICCSFLSAHPFASKKCI